MATRSKPRPRRESPEEFEQRTAPRLMQVGVALALLHVVLLGRLVHLQIVRHKELSAESLTRWRAPRTITPARGLIYDRNGALLVENEPGFSVVVDPNRWFVGNSTNPLAKDLPEDRRAHALRVLGRYFPEPALAWIKKLDLSQRTPKHPFPTREVAQWVPAETIERLRQTTVDFAPPVAKELKKRKGALAQPHAELPGVSYPPSSRRVAVNGTLASHVLGFTDQSGSTPWRGIELSLNSSLAGDAGKVTYEVDRFGMIPGTEEVRHKLTPGSHVYLTLDAELQHDVEQALGTAVTRHQAESGAAIVLDIKNGDVLAMASAPTYNINDARTPKPGTKPVLAPRINWALERPYEPGSTLKAMTIAAALEEKEVTAQSLFACNGSRKILTNTIHCATHGGFSHGHGTQNLGGVVSHSCNLATAECGAKLGSKRLYQYLTDFGMGERTKIGLPGEERGLLRDPERRIWRPIDLATISFGQGISVTPLQLAAAYTVFGDGRYHSPRLVRATRNTETKVIEERPLSASHRVLSEETAATMRTLLGGAIDEGTGLPAQIPGYTAGGKTGTAQIPENGHYSKRFVASFVGVAPLKDPQFVILTLVRDPKGGDHYGGSVAGPVFKQIAERALLLRRTPHDREKTLTGVKKKAVTVEA